MQFNAELSQKAIDQIEAYPELWDQSAWGTQNRCGTAHCWFGWCLAIDGRGSDLDLFVDITWLSNLAPQTIGLDWNSAEFLRISDSDNDIEDLKYYHAKLAAGESIEFDRDGYDGDGIDRDGFDAGGIDRQGYNESGYDWAGYDRCGYDCNGLDSDGFDSLGIDSQGFNLEGYDENGFDRKGFDRKGYDENGFDRKGYDCKGFDADGYDVDEYDCDGFDPHDFDRDGFDRDGIVHNSDEARSQLESELAME